MHIKDYETAISWLFEQFPSYQLIGEKAYKPTLENTLKLSELFARPQDGHKFVHVAGSNGKGSVSSMMASTFTESGYTTGLFTSPHIKDFRERIRVNGKMIDKSYVIDFVNKVQSLDLDFSPSFFEITFIMCLCYFRDQNVDIAVIETGLGGRLDATNIITPLISVITSISLEHTHILGENLEEIAFEKAGIIKYNIPVIIGDVPNETKDVFFNKANSTNSPLYFSDPEDIGSLDLPLLGSYQRTNLKTTKKALSILEKELGIRSMNHIQEGLNNLAGNTGFKGRLQMIKKKPDVYLDVSHNIDGIQKTLATFQKDIPNRRLHVIYGSSSDKDLNRIAEILPKDVRYYFTSFKHARSASQEQLVNAFQEQINHGGKIFDDPKKAFEAALEIANEQDSIIIMGSFFLVEDFF